MKTNLEWFRTFCVVYDTCNMHEAATRLCMSQPAVSQQINALEEYVGFKLFERTTRQIMPNERAVILYQQISGAMAQFETVEMNFLRTNGKVRQTISLGIHAGLFGSMLKRHIYELETNMIVQFGDDDQLNKLFNLGTLDMIVSETPRHEKGVKCRTIGALEYILTAAAGTDISGMPMRVGDDVEYARQWSLQQLWSATSDRRQLNKMWSKLFGREPDFAPNYVIPSYSILVHSLIYGRGLAVVPTNVSKRYIKSGELMQLWPEEARTTSNHYIIQRHNATNASQIEQLEELIVKEFQKISGTETERED